LPRSSISTRGKKKAREEGKGPWPRSRLAASTTIFPLHPMTWKKKKRGREGREGGNRVSNDERPIPNFLPIRSSKILQEKKKEVLSLVSEE